MLDKATLDPRSNRWVVVPAYRAGPDHVPHVRAVPPPGGDGGDGGYSPHRPEVGDTWEVAGPADTEFLFGANAQPPAGEES
jgi:hypothetical protein